MTRAKHRPLSAALCALVLAGCAAGADASSTGSAPTADTGTPLGALTSSLAPLRSGVLDFAVVSYPGSEGDSGAVGYRLTGPFSDPQPGQSLPVMRLTLDPVGRGGTAATVVSTGRQAWVEQGGRQTSLSAAQISQMAVGTHPGQDLTGLSQLDVATWARGSETRSTVTIDGTTADDVTATVDPVAALNGIDRLAQQAVGTSGGRVIPSTGAAAAAIRRALRSSRLEVAVGHADRVLRLFRLDLIFGAAASDPIRSALGQLAGPRLEVRVAVTSANRPAF